MYWALLPDDMRDTCPALLLLEAGCLAFEGSCFLQVFAQAAIVARKARGVWPVTCLKLREKWA